MAPRLSPVLAAAALALPPTQAARAQAHRAVDGRDLVESINRSLSGVLSDNAPQYELVPGRTSLSLSPGPPLALIAAAAAISAAVILVPAASVGTGASIVIAIVLGPPTATTLDAFFSLLTESPPMDADELAGQSPLLGFFRDRMTVRYRLDGPDGGVLHGYCLAFFALGENPDGGHDLHYALDACAHTEAFPQAVPSGPGDPRIGPEGVDAWDTILGQDRVVAKGSVPVP